MKEHPLPKAWKWMKLDEVCIATKNRDPRITPDLSFRYVDISSVNNRLKRIIDTRTILGKDAPSRARQIIKANDVIVSMTRPNLNAVALVPEDLNNEICSTGFCVLRPTEFIGALFLFEFVQSKYFIETVSGKVRGMLYPAITDNQVREVNIPIPPLPEQKRIAIKTQELIQDVERARIACEKQLEAAKALSSAYLREVFESEEAKKWEKKRLGQICYRIIGGGTPSRGHSEYWGDPIYWLSPSELKENKINYIKKTKEKITEEGSRNSNAKLIPLKSVLLSCTASVGKVAINEVPLSTNQQFNSFVLRDTIAIPEYIAYYLIYKRDDIKQLGGKTTFTFISKDEIANLLVFIPSLSIQHRIIVKLKEKMAQVEELRTGIEKQLESINALPQEILKKAFKGEL